MREAEGGQVRGVALKVAAEHERYVVALRTQEAAHCTEVGQVGLPQPAAVFQVNRNGGERAMPRRLNQRGNGTGRNKLMGSDARRGDAQVTPCEHRNPAPPAVAVPLQCGCDDGLPPVPQCPGRSGWNISGSQVMLLAERQVGARPQEVPPNGAPGGPINGVNDKGEERLVGLAALALPARQHRAVE